MGLLYWIIVGLIAGWLAGQVMRGGGYGVLFDIILGMVGAHRPEGLWVIIGQLGTFYYFFHILILIPILGKLERPRPLPVSIGAAVLTPAPGFAGAGSTERH